MGIINTKLNCKSENDNEKNKKYFLLINKIIKRKNIIRNNFNIKDYISPSYINFKNPKYCEIDGMFYSGIIIVDYYKEQKEIILNELINLNINFIISIFYEKENSKKIINKLTYNIGNISTDINNKNINNQIIDLEEIAYNDAKYIRKEIQLNNEDIFYLYIYINIFNRDIKELENNLNKIEGILKNKGLNSRRGYFRQEQLFLASLP